MKRIIKQIKYISVTFVLSVIFISCSKDKQILTDSKWVVENIKVHADSTTAYKPMFRDREIILSFSKENVFILTMEANGGGGSVRFGSNNTIHFKETMPRTERCCDSHFAETCLSLLTSKINHYKRKGNNLTFTGDNGETINLIKQE